MSSRWRVPISALAGAALVVAGVLLLGWAGHIRSSAEEQLRTALTRAMGRAHELDLMTRLPIRDGQLATDHDVRVARLAARVAAASAAADNPDERNALDAVRACLAAPTCAGTLENAVLAAKEIYARPLRSVDNVRRGQAIRSDRLVLAGVAGLVAGLLVLLWAASRSIADEYPLTEPDEDLHRKPENHLEKIQTGPAPNLEEALRDRLEQLYQVRKRAQDNDRFAAFGEIAAGLSHGLKTPLAAVRAAAQVAQAKIGFAHPAADNLDDIIDEVDGLVDQIVRFLATMGSGMPALQQLTPRAILSALDNYYRRDEHHHEPGAGARWACAISSESGSPDDPELPVVAVEPELLQMALRNLIDNAFAFAPEDTVVRLSAALCDPPARVGLDEKPPANELQAARWIEFSVSDRGPGIPRDIAQRETHRSERPTGNGLGLAIARRIAARHGGRLELDTRTGDGTVARVVLPPANLDVGKEPA